MHDPADDFPAIHFNEDARRVLLRAEREAAERNHPTTDVDHLLLALLLEHGEAARFLETADVDTSFVRSQLDGALRVALSTPQAAPAVAPRVQLLLERAGEISPQVSSMDLLRAFLTDRDQVTLSLMEMVGLGDFRGPKSGLIEALGFPAPSVIGPDPEPIAQAS